MDLPEFPKWVLESDRPMILSQLEHSVVSARRRPIDWTFRYARFGLRSVAMGYVWVHRKSMKTLPYLKRERRTEQLQAWLHQAFAVVFLSHLRQSESSPETILKAEMMIGEGLPIEGPS